MAILRPSSDLITGGWQGSPPGIVTSKQVWRQQPQIVVGRYSSHWFWSKNPLWVYLPANRDINLGNLRSDSGIMDRPIQPVCGGTGWRGSNDQVSNARFHFTAPSTPYFHTHVLVFATKGNTANSYGVVIADSAHNVFSHASSTGATQLDFIENGMAKSFPLSLNKATCIVVSRGSTSEWKTQDPIWAQDGIPCGTRLTDASSNYAQATFAVGNHISLPRAHNGVILFSAYLSGLLTQVEANDLSLNPWQIFKPLNRISYFLPPLYSTLDESTYSDTDYISTSTAGDIARVSLGTYTAEAPALILKRDVWKQQPQVPVGIDYGKYSPAFVYSPTNSILMPVLGSLLTQTGTVTKAPTAKGISAKIAVSGYLSRTSYAPIRTSNGAFTGDFTAIVLANPAAGASSGRTLISQRLDSGGFNQFGITANANSLGSASGSIFFATYDSAYTSCELAGAVDGLWHVWAIRRKGTVLTGWKDGIQIASVDGAVRSIGSSSAGFGIGVAPPSYNILSAVDIPFASGFNYALTDAQMCELGANPWQIFKPKSRPIFITPPRGTHTLKYRAASPEADRGLIARVLELGQPPAIILKRDVWRTQPQAAIELNPVYKIDTSKSVLRQIDFTKYTGGSLPSVGVKGLGHSFNGTDQSRQISATTGTGNLSVIIVFKADNAAETGGYGCPLSAHHQFEIMWGAGGTDNGVRFAPNPESWVSIPLRTQDKTTDWHTIVLTRSSTTVLKAWCDGAYLGSVSGTANGSTDWPLYLGRMSFAYGSYHWPGKINLCTVAPVIYPEALCKDLSANPYQIFKPKSRPIFIDAPKVIASHTKTYTELGTTPAEQTLTLSSGEVASITNGAELALEVEST